MAKVKKKQENNIQDEEVAKKMLEMLDSGYSWDEIAEEMCEIGQLNAFKRNYEVVKFICETDELEKGVK